MTEPIRIKLTPVEVRRIEQMSQAVSSIQQRLRAAQDEAARYTMKLVADRGFEVNGGWLDLIEEGDDVVLVERRDESEEGESDDAS